MAEETANKEEEQQAAEADAVKKKDDKDAEGSKGPSPKLIVLVLAMNVLVLVALAAIMWMSYKKSSSQVSLGDIAASDKEDKGGEHGAAEGGEKGGEHGGGEGKEGEKKEAGGSQFIKESFTVNLADSRGAHYASVDVEFEVDNDFVKDELERIRPKIRDFITIVLSSKTYEQVESIDGREFLREEIRNKVNGYLTRGQVKNVYFTQFIVQ